VLRSPGSSSCAAPAWPSCQGHGGQRASIWPTCAAGQVSVWGEGEGAAVMYERQSLCVLPDVCWANSTEQAAHTMCVWSDVLVWLGCKHCSRHGHHTTAAALATHLLCGHRCFRVGLLAVFCPHTASNDCSLQGSRHHSVAAAQLRVLPGDTCAWLLQLTALLSCLSAK
jgi:hypothetical protein